MRSRNLLPGVPALLVALAAALPAAAGHEILLQDLDEARHGYTVLRVSGDTPFEVGRSLGEALAEDIVASVVEVRERLATGDRYDEIRGLIDSLSFITEELEQEIRGVVQGVHEVLPAAELDELDVKLRNTYGDWGWIQGCRSHSCWGRYVAPPVRTLSTRRLDMGTPFQSSLHHVLCAFDPTDGGVTAGVRWVGLASPGYLVAVTAVNEFGTMASLHDYGSGASLDPGQVSRAVAARHLLTGFPPDLAPDEQLDWAEGEMTAMTLATSSFINYFVPDGPGGVFACHGNGSCDPARRPHPDYRDGEVLLTTNAATDGSTVPSGGDFMDAYYEQGHPKDLASHFELMGDTGLHLMSVAVRGREDMTIWFHGRDMEQRIELEWSKLFAARAFEPIEAADSDATDEADAEARHEIEVETNIEAAESGFAGRTRECGCGAARSNGPQLLWLVPALLARGPRRRGFASRERR